MSLKDNLLFLGQPKDGKEKQTVFGKLAELLVETVVHRMLSWGC